MEMWFLTIIAEGAGQLDKEMDVDELSSPQPIEDLCVTYTRGPELELEMGDGGGGFKPRGERQGYKLKGRDVA
jgi:hypothetical protein